MNRIIEPESQTQASQQPLFIPWEPDGEIVMPSLQGGEMLYPTFAGRDGWGGQKVGLINARGEVVAPRMYDYLRYVTDEETNTTIIGLLAGRLDSALSAHRWVYYGLDGAILAEPSHLGYMNPFPGGRYAEYADQYIDYDMDESRVDGGIWSLEENRPLLAAARGQEVSRIGTDRFFVVTRTYDFETWESTITDAFIFNAKTGAKTPAPEGVSEINAYEVQPGDLLIPAMNQGSSGYVDRNLAWVIPPHYDYAIGFNGRDFALANDGNGRYYVINATGTVIYVSEYSLSECGDYISLYDYETGLRALFRVRNGKCETLLTPSAAREIFWMQKDLFAISDRETGSTVFRDFATGKDICRVDGFYDYIQPINASLVELRINVHEKFGSTVFYNIRQKREIALPENWEGYIEVVCPWMVMAHNYTANETLLFDADGRPLGDSVGAFNYTPWNTASYAWPNDLLPAFPWVTQGLYAGYIDEHGAWLYRQSRYQGLED